MDRRECPVKFFKVYRSSDLVGSLNGKVESKQFTSFITAEEGGLFTPYGPDKIVG